VFLLVELIANFRPSMSDLAVISSHLFKEFLHVSLIRRSQGVSMHFAFFGESRVMRRWQWGRWCEQTMVVRDL
jgi:hypothetical protein